MTAHIDFQLQVLQTVRSQSVSERCINGSKTSVCFCFLRVSASHKFASIDSVSSTQMQFINSVTGLYGPLNDQMVYKNAAK